MVVILLTLNKIFLKLRKRNKENYKQLQFCIMLAIFLISSFISIVLNPAIQGALPVGGDSRKQVYMIFCVAVVGCFVFTIYAANLFFRYKSREIGIFLALGAKKKDLSKALYTDLCKIILTQTLLGIVLGAIAAYIALSIFKAAFPLSVENISFVSVSGLAVSVIFSLFVGFCIIIKAYWFTRKSNIVDILYEQRKSESLKENITKKYFIIGIVCLIVGILAGGVGTSVYSRITKRSLGAWTNLFYLFSLFGLYRVLIYSIVVHKKDKNPQKYYKNIISYGLLKFQGKSIVKNMLIVSLLVVCALFACLYSPSKYLTDQVAVKSNPIDFTFSYPHNADELQKKDILKLAKKHNIKITEYYEAEFIRLLGSGVNRDDIDDAGNIIEIYEKEYMYFSFISESAYNKITGRNVKIRNGTYKFLINDVMYENIYNKYKDLDYVTNEYSNIEKAYTYAGTEKFGGLVSGDGFYSARRHIISDEDYKELSKALPDEMRVRNILFNVDDINSSYQFSKDLYKEYCNRASDNMLHMWAYDEHQEQVFLEKWGEYGYSDKVEPNPDHPEEYCDWKYAPAFRILDIKNGFLTFAIFYMLFIYVTVICLAAVGIISYTRSITVAVNNQKVFEDVKKLGANNVYLEQILQSQIKKVFVLPTIMGCLIMLVWFPLILWQNDGTISAVDIQIIGVEILLCLFIAVYQFFIYKLSMKKAQKIVYNNS